MFGDLFLVLCRYVTFVIKFLLKRFNLNLYSKTRVFTYYYYFCKIGGLILLVLTEKS